MNLSERHIEEIPMPNFVAVSRDRHAAKRWIRYDSYKFAGKEAVLPLVAAELSKAVIAMPIGFINPNSIFTPAAMLGLKPGKNLFVAQDGRWVGGYIPSILRGYPFRLAHNEENRLILCVDEDSGLVTDHPVGELFFDEAGEPSESVRQVLNFLQTVEQSRVATATACEMLDRYGVIKPWPITLKGDAGEHTIDGLFRVDEAALNQLSDDAFLELRRVGALLIAYCQLLSMQNLDIIANLAKAHAVHEGNESASDTPDNGNSTVDWSQFKGF
jgi:hypothetical protein